MIKAVLFDLDGTLLPMDHEKFIKQYFGSLTEFLATRILQPKQFMSALGSGIKAMLHGDGSKSNEQAFWDEFSNAYGTVEQSDLDTMQEYYRTQFACTRQACSPSPKARAVVDMLHKAGLKVVLATNPLFPAVATRQRIEWAGLTTDDFLLYTTYENSRFTKPSHNYYKDILYSIGVQPHEAVMVGNDVSDDMSAAELGLKVFLLTDCLINLKNKDTSPYPQGGFDDLIEFLKGLV